jgi:hypothetical protein
MDRDFRHSGQFVHLGSPEAIVQVKDNHGGKEGVSLASRRKVIVLLHLANTSLDPKISFREQSTAAAANGVTTNNDGYTFKYMQGCKNSLDCSEDCLLVLDIEFDIIHLTSVARKRFLECRVEEE